MKKIFIVMMSFVVCIIIFGIFFNMGVEASEVWVNYGFYDEKLYDETNTYDYIIKKDENGTIVDKKYNMETKTNKIISNDAPLLTVLTPGLGSYANTWSLGSDTKGNIGFTYIEDSLINRLYNSVGEANIYWYYFSSGTKKFTIIDIGKQTNYIKQGSLNFYSTGNNLVKDSAGNDRITDISKPIILLFQSSDPSAGNDYVYEEFNYAISKAIYDIKILNNGVLPKINLIGHSRGGLTNLQYALDHPDLVHSIYSIGTPYLGSTSAMVDMGLGGIIGGGIGESEIIDKNIYMDYVTRWNENYESLYKNIKVHALGGYSSLNFLLNTFTKSSMLSTAIIGVLISLEIKMILSHIVPLDMDIFLNYALSELSAHFANDNALAAFGDILMNEIVLESQFPFIYIKNDGLVDLNSQLGSKQINSSNVTYKGFIKKSFCFREDNTNREALASKNSYSVVHNLETRHKDILDYIVKNISMSGKIDSLYETYNISSTEIGIRSIIKSISHTTLEIPETINGKTVVEIADSAFANDFNGNTTITKVIIPNTIKIIGSNSFGNCENLETVVFEENSSLQKIDDYAFYNCISLDNVDLPSNIQMTGELVFLNCILMPEYDYNNSNIYDIGSINCMSEEIRDYYYLNKNFSMYFKFTVECEYEYDFNAIAEEGIKMWLYDSNLELLFEETTSINDGTNTAIIENLTPGEYYLRITAVDRNYSGEVEVIVDNDINGREELAVDIETDVLKHLHNGHNEFFFMRNKTEFYEFLLIAEAEGEIIFPEGAITIFDSNNNIVEKYTIQDLEYNNNADSVYGSNGIVVCVEEYMNYYIDIDVDPTIEYTSLQIVALTLSNRTLDSEDNLLDTEYKTGDKIEVIDVKRTGHYNVEITYSGNQTEEILYVILKKDSNNNFTVIDKFLLNNENNAVTGDYIFNGGEVLYVGYFNNQNDATIKLDINRIIKEKFDLMIDPNMNVVVGTEITVNKGSCNETTITQGYTRICYLGMYAPNLESRTLYDWYSDDEEVAKVSIYGTITATATWTDDTTNKRVKIKAIYKKNSEIQGEIEVLVYKETKTDKKYLQYGMDVRESAPITGSEVTTGKGYPIDIATSPTVEIHKSNTRLICLGNDSPSKIIQDFVWTSENENIATVSQYGTITANHSGETKIYGVYKYNSRYLVEITVVVITG